MDDLSSSIAPAETPSTVIDTQPATAPSGGGAPRTLETEPSLRDVISEEVKKADPEPKADAKPDAPKDDKPAKDAAKSDFDKPADEKSAPARDDGGKFASSKPKDEGQAPATADASPSEQGEKGEGKTYSEAPKSFLPDSKEHWRNTPRTVQRDVAIMERTYEEALSRSRQDNERYESIRQFDDLARQNGRELRDSLQKMTEVENALKRDPIVGLDQILREIGPRKADGSPVSIYEVANYIVQQGPDALQQRFQQAREATPAQPDPRVAQAEAEAAELKAKLVQVEVIAPFKAEHPRYDELEEAIAQILQSGIIAPGLSAHERLEAAYVYAERLNPPSTRSAQDNEAPAPERRADESLSGSKSIKSAPGAVSSDFEPERGGSIRELLQDELRRSKRS